MAGTPDATWFEAMRRANVEPVVHCAISLSGVTMNVHNWSSGSLDSTITGDPLLSSITVVTQSVDPVHRSVQVSELTLELTDDGKIRSLVSTQNFLNSAVSVSLGAPDVTLGNFELIFKGTILRIFPGEGKISLKVRSLEASIADKRNMRTHFNTHPFNVLKQMLEDSGVASGDIDTTSFTPSTYSADISHYCFSSLVVHPRGPYDHDDFDTHIRGPIGDAVVEHVLVDWSYHVLDFRSFANEILKLTRTSLFVNTAGKVALKHFDSSVSTEYHFTTNDYSDFEQIEQDPLIFNRVNLGFRNSGGHRFARKDATSITNYEEQSLEMDVLYLAPVSAYRENASSVPIAAPIYGGFAGTIDLYSSQAADEVPSSDRPVYWLHRREVLKATSAFTMLQSQYGNVLDEDGDRTGAAVYMPNSVSMNGITSRPFAGATSNESNPSREVWDVTAAYDFGTYILERFSNTCPKVRITTTLEFAYLELGDLVSLDNDVFLSPELALDGLSSTVKFEITGKEITPLGDSVGIVFDLYYATQATPPGISLADLIPDSFDTIMPNSLIQAVNAAGISANAVYNGLDLSTSSALVGSMSEGACSGGGQVFRANPAAQTFTCTASKDNYIGIDLYSGNPIVTPVTLGVVEPALLPGEVRLGKAVTDGSGITSILDLRRFGSASIEQIDHEAIEPGLNALWNPSFNIWPDTTKAPPGWTAVEGVAGTDFLRESTSKKSGRYALECAVTGTNARLDSDFIPVDKNKVYEISCWSYQAGASITGVFGVYWFQDDRTASAVDASDFVVLGSTATGSWLNFLNVIQPPSDAAFARLTVGRTSSPGAIVYYDDLAIKLKEPSFLVYNPTNSSWSKGVADQIEFESVSYDYGERFTPSTSKWYYEVPQSGLYHFEAAITFASDWDYSSHADYITAYITRTRGGSATTISTAFGSPRTTTRAFAQVSTLAECDAGDLIKVYTQPGFDGPSNGPIAQTGINESWFSGTKLR